MKRELDRFPKLHVRSRLMDNLRIGPRKPMPFPSSGKMVLLALCPSCGNKQMPLWYAPSELGYQTECLGCRQRLVVKPQGMELGDISRYGGFHQSPFDHHTRHGDGELVTGDATRLYDSYRDRHDVGVKRAHKLGMIPRVIEDVQ